MEKRKKVPPVSGMFKKGQSGNPKGRPKKLPELRKLLDEVLGDEAQGMSAAEAIFKKWRQMAVQGNLKAGELLITYAYGKPTQKVALDDEFPNEITIKVAPGLSSANLPTSEDDIIEPE